MKTYGEKLRDPRWQRKRLEILTRDNFTCQMCKSTESELHVHHRSYESGRDPWDYKGNHYVTLCDACHHLVENLVLSVRFNASNVQYFKVIKACHILLKNKNPVVSDSFSKIIISAVDLFYEDPDADKAHT